MLTDGPFAIMEPMPTHRRLAAMQRLACLAAVVLSVSLAACSSATALLATASPGTGTLVTVTMHGGACTGVPCDSSVYLDADGHVHAATKPPNDLGQVSSALMATLATAIAATDFAAIRSHPFTGQCPTAAGGQELIFEFAVGGGTQRIASCEVAIDWGSPLFVALAAALAQWVPMPVS
jgi:hypothetical protein